MHKEIKTIIGSGLSGPLLAIFLSQRDYQVQLYEKRLDLRREKISAGRSINLALSHRGINALKSANVFDAIEPHMIPMKGRMIHHINGELEFQSYSIHDNEHINSVSRGELNKILMDKAEESGNVDIYFDHFLSQIDEIKKRLLFENGNKVNYDNHVIGADGAGSIIRKFIDSKSNFPSKSEPLGHGYKELHVAPGLDEDFQLDPNALHIWPRGEFMLIALPNTDKSFTCTLFLPNEGKISFKSLISNELVYDFFNDNFTDVIQLLENFPESYFNNPVGKLATIYADQWQYKNQFCLIGDAAHAVVPFFGQGMNASFEDCHLLMKCLDELNGDWNNLFVKYNLERKPDADAIAKMAIENYFEMRKSVAEKEFISKKKIANELFMQYPDRFIPRYNMVSFTSIPYSEVYRRGNIQKEIISSMNLEKPNFNALREMIEDKLTLLN
tara:strand:+ start:1379 stop:2707 length:1329 start_codon:yes stop_codon:yes gene_type:complete